MPRAGLTWMQIAERIPGRIGKQCRERWTNHLDPNLKKGGWTHEEDTILAEAQQRWGNAWTKIAKLLPGRAEHAVKNRWNSAFRRKKSAMFGKGPPQDEDTATIARARTQMEARNVELNERVAALTVLGASAQVSAAAVDTRTIGKPDNFDGADEDCWKRRRHRRRRRRRRRRRLRRRDVVDVAQDGA